MQPPHGLLEQFQRPWQGQEDDLVATKLKVKPVAGAFGMDGQEFCSACVPVLDGVVFVYGCNFELPLKLG